MLAVLVVVIPVARSDPSNILNKQSYDQQVMFYAERVLLIRQVLLISSSSGQGEVINFEVGDSLFEEVPIAFFVGDPVAGSK